MPRGRRAPKEKVYNKDSIITVRKTNYPFAGYVSSHPNGISIELVKNSKCICCDKPIVNKGALSVFRYRGSQGATEIIRLHKDCIYKQLILRKEGTCIICGEKGAEHTFKPRIKHKYGAYHRECIEEFVTKNDAAFNVMDSKFEKVHLAIKYRRFDQLQKVRTATEADYILENIDDRNDLLTLIRSNKAIRKRFFIKFSARINEKEYNEDYLMIVTEFPNELRNAGYLWSRKIEISSRQELWEKFDLESQIGLMRGDIEASFIMTNWDTFAPKVKKVIVTYLNSSQIPCGFWIEQWSTLSVEEQVLLAREQKATKMGFIKEQWETFDIEVKKSVCSNFRNDLTWQFILEYIIDSNDDNLLTILKTHSNKNISSQVALAIGDGERVLTRSW